VDAIRERRAPFDPESVCFEFAACLRSYGIATMQSDKYAGVWVTEAFARHGVRVEQSAAAKSDLYLSLLPLLNSKRVVLLDNKRLIAQLCGLERRTARSGRDSIDHAQGRRGDPASAGHDDVCNAVAGAVSLAIANVGVHVSPELLQRVAAMPPNPHRRHTAWGFAKRAAFTQMIVPQEMRGYPSHILPAERQWLATKSSDEEGEAR